MMSDIERLTSERDGFKSDWIKAMKRVERLTAYIVTLEDNMDHAGKRIEKLEAALVEIANSGVGVHSAWGWLAPFAHKALAEMNDE